MRDLNLGPESKKLIERYNTLDRDQRSSEDKAYEWYSLAMAMSKMLERWNTIAWCWPDNCPAQICGGPHFKVTYKDNDFTQEVIEPYNNLGSTFANVPYTVERP